MEKITVKDVAVSVIKVNDEDYISLTDMLKAKDGEFFFSNWLRNRNTVEFLGIWEKLVNPDFNYAEFDIIKSQAGLNSYRLSAKEWMQKTNAIGIISKTGRYGGTYAHKDIAFEFAMWISPEFKVYLIRGIPAPERAGTGTTRLERKTRTVQDQLSHPYRRDQTKSDSGRSDREAGEHHLCQ